MVDPKRTIRCSDLLEKMLARAVYSTAVQPCASTHSFSSSGSISAWRGRPSAISHQLTWVEVKIWKSGLMAFGSSRHPSVRTQARIHRRWARL
jgi:hypothetical protein